MGKPLDGDRDSDCDDIFDLPGVGLTRRLYEGISK